MDDPDRPGASFLRADLDLANSFLDIADTTRQVNVRNRNIANAWKAHDAVVRLAPKVGIKDSELIAITERLRVLRTRLERMEAQDSK
jgi:hypothetical protein